MATELTEERVVELMERVVDAGHDAVVSAAVAEVEAAWSQLERRLRALEAGGVAPGYATPSRARLSPSNDELSSRLGEIERRLDELSGYTPPAQSHHVVVRGSSFGREALVEALTGWLEETGFVVTPRLVGRDHVLMLACAEWPLG